ncbi:hypothetical protein QBC44DRAFT_39054 [Cladorrhinum sp. PSN332]|nr:hypothetical protein QBC44DRAFT_39054 [Cladorrhinum sp. PSN332]
MRWDIMKSRLYYALVDHLVGDHTCTPVMELLLTKGAALKFLGASAEKTGALLRYLDELGMKTRLFRRVFPREGDQPEGYHGLPS